VTSITSQIVRRTYEALPSGAKQGSSPAVHQRPAIRPNRIVCDLLRFILPQRQRQQRASHFPLSWHQHRYRHRRIKKKEADISNVNKEYFQSHSHAKIRIEMDEVGSYWHDKKHQIWLWWAVDHDTGEVVAFWFGTREHGHLDKLLELLSLLDIGNVYTDGNDAYYKRIDSDVLVVTKKEHAEDRAKAFVVADVVQPIGSQGHSIFQNGTDAQNRRRFNYQCPVFWISSANSMILEHYHIFGKLIQWSWVYLHKSNTIVYLGINVTWIYLLFRW
jgi:IS1 family transposase